MTEELTKLLDDLVVRLNAAIKAGSGMELNAAEVVVWFDSLRLAQVKIASTVDMAHIIGQALRSVRLQVHIDPATGIIDGIEPMPSGADSGTVN